MKYWKRHNLIEDLFYVLPVVALVFVILMFSGCDRREMYVYGDEFHSVDLEVDWSSYVAGVPDGMTVWFYPLDNPSHPAYRSTTSNVWSHDFYLPGGRYHGLVIDYSPEEHSRQQFLDMDSLQGARVEATPAVWQPDSLTVIGGGVPHGLSDEVNQVLFGEAAWTELMTNRPPIREENGLYTVANQPEMMALDTLLNKYIDPGIYGDYIPWKERNTYQSTLVVDTLNAEPLAIIWKFYIRIWVSKGFNYLWQTPASITGLADGHYLPLNVNTSRPCLISIDGWDYVRTGDNTGYIETSVNTFGLPARSGLPLSRAEDLADGDLRLNLSFVLRDHATVVSYHFNVGEEVEIYDSHLLMQVEIGPVELPYVDAYNGAGFSAEVTPWEKKPPVDVHF